jgi:hypothetical protein
MPPYLIVFSARGSVRTACAFRASPLPCRGRRAWGPARAPPPARRPARAAAPTLRRSWPSAREQLLGRDDRGQHRHPGDAHLPEREQRHGQPRAAHEARAAVREPASQGGAPRLGCRPTRAAAHQRPAFQRGQLERGSRQQHRGGGRTPGPVPSEEPALEPAEPQGRVAEQAGQHPHGELARRERGPRVCAGLLQHRPHRRRQHHRDHHHRPGDRVRGERAGVRPGPASIPAIRAMLTTHAAAAIASNTTIAGTVDVPGRALRPARVRISVASRRQPPRSSECPAASRGHWAIGRPSVRRL